MFVIVFLLDKKKIPHTGDIKSLDRCGQQHQRHSRVDREYTKTKKNLKTEKIFQNGKTQKRLEICQNKRYTLRPEVSNPSGSVVSTIFCKAKSTKKNFFCALILDHIPTEMFYSETNSFQHSSHRDSESLKILDIRLQEVGAKQASKYTT